MTASGPVAPPPPAPGVPLHAQRRLDALDGDGLAALMAWSIAFYMSFDGLLPLAFRERWLPPLLLATFIVARRHALLGRMLPFLNAGMLASLAWVMLSVSWSAMASQVYTQALAIAGVLVIALAFVMAGWHEARFGTVLAAASSAALIGSLLVALAFPHIGVHEGTAFEIANSWRGLTYQKNGLGQLSAVALILWTHLWASRRVSARAAAAGAALAVLLLLKSRSSTSLMLSLISCAVILMLLRPPLFIGTGARRLFGVAAFVLLPTALLLAMRTSVFAPIGGLFGKDGTFSGRTLIWDQMFIEIAQHPWLGTGYNSFWTWGVDGPSLRLREALQWTVPSAHNGYLDVINEQGYLGFVLFLAMLAGHCVALARLSRLDRTAYAFHMPLFLYMLLANVTESGWYRPIELLHLLFISSSVEISRRLFAHALYRDQAARGALRRPE